MKMIYLKQIVLVIFAIPSDSHVTRAFAYVRGVRVIVVSGVHEHLTLLSYL
jgi:hypothetical protein